MRNSNDILIFTDGNLSLNVKISPEQDTVWLSRQQMAELFDRDIKTIGKHINNAIAEELHNQVVIAKFATTTQHGAIKGKTQTHITEHYNLDIIISVGYRVKSKRGIAFRKWANSVLKDYILKGYAINKDRVNKLDKVIKVMKRSENTLDAKQVLTVIEQYNLALNLLDDYDHQRVAKPKGKKAIYVLSYKECKDIIFSMRFGNSSSLFGNEKDESFKGSISAIYQTFNGEELYPSIEEKAANLLYFVVKNHSFTDGNKRIAAAIFLHFLNKNDALFNNNEKIITDHTLVALTIMIAESNPKEKEMMVSIIMNCIVGENY